VQRDCSGLCGGANESCGCMDPRACDFVWNATTSVVDGREAACTLRDVCQVCGGRNDTCPVGAQSRCSDKRACNFNSVAASGADGLGNRSEDCVFPPRGRSCEGHCVVRTDCRGVCGGKTKQDICGVCEGNGTRCIGCRDSRACNFNPLATRPGPGRGACRFPEPFHDCAGRCVAEVDCLGNCNGRAGLDRCGVCGGDGHSCAGCLDEAACNYNASHAFSNPLACRYAEAGHDCTGTCVAGADRCGVCGGDNSTCGCTDQGSCNYDPNAENDDGSCFRPPSEHHACDGSCRVKVDCTGVCGGPAEEDVCGLCGGDGSSCEFCPPLCTSGRYSPTHPCRTQASVWGWCQVRTARTWMQ
jgi:hypothetical protein